jgi:branched-chain amino acid transport system substrate-binding protein
MRSLRRASRLIALIVAGGFLLAACAPSAPGPSAAPQAAAKQGAAPSGQPVRIGVPLDLTGNISATGKHQEAGIEVAVKQAGGSVAGRPIELVIIDTEGLPEPALRVTRQMVERDNVDVLVGYLNSASGYAVRDFIHESRKPTVTMAAAAGLTRENKSPYIWRMIPSTFQWSYEPTKYIKDKLGAKRIIYWGWDLAAGREAYRAVKAVYGDGVVQEIFTPFNTVDYAPYVSSIKPGDADMVVAAVFGADSPRLADQYQRSGLREKMPLVGFGAFTSEEVLPGYAPEAINGVQASYVYCSALDNAANREFVARFKERAGGLPGHYAYASYLGMRMMIQAIEAVGGDTSNPDRLVAALAKAKLENTPTGTHSFDANQGWVSDFFWLKVDLENGQPVNKCVDRLPEVADPIKEFPTVN